jgi:hypothetical protein
VFIRPNGPVPVMALEWRIKVIHVMIDD